MLCAISGEAPVEPVVSKKTGTVYEKRLIEKYITDNNTDPITGEELDLEDLLPLKSERVVKPRPPTLTSIPALLNTFQNEWDALALESFKVKQELSRSREELANALYQHDAAVRVIARLTRERDEARTALSRVTVSAGGGAGDEAMAVDQEVLSDELAAKVDEVQQRMSKSRKKRPVPDGWAIPEEISSFTQDMVVDSVALPQTVGLIIHDDVGVIASHSGKAAVLDLSDHSIGAKVTKSIQVNAPITMAATTEEGTIAFGSTKGTLSVYRKGKRVANLHEHAGAITGVAVHPGQTLAASVGVDKSIVLYNLETFEKAARTFTDASLTTCAFHPDGHLLAAGTTTGDIKMYATKSGDHMASFTLGAPVQALAFSENGYWIAAAGKGQTTVTIFDLRKEGDAATAKVLDTGASVVGLSWDYSGQFLATAGPSGVTVQQYSKSSKKWTEPVRNGSPAVGVSWGADAKTLVSVNQDGVLTILSSANKD